MNTKMTNRSCQTRLQRSPWIPTKRASSSKSNSVVTCSAPKGTCSRHQIASMSYIIDALLVHVIWLLISAVGHITVGRICLRSFQSQITVNMSWLPGRHLNDVYNETLSNVMCLKDSKFSNFVILNCNEEVVPGGWPNLWWHQYDAYNPSLKAVSFTVWLSLCITYIFCTNRHSYPIIN